ncbi:1-deoxyxylulose-5-phosphate synthase YajO-like isoform X2 [Mytilus californianus]|uniref:1-deoxyxylulose-5-phosphate synthase YajO-like isoform X2 n=1 Tax=Mytilus californianus TaxID=6549 RepID=UPI002245DC85|nr:1-deoxyxylulose-5-phosphate synthase YajO-like isoform X2 [Mytilus californianus]XP_052057643.1 1-deoxyxylulose-5-phosphate synthase YajO-like isoform X2 [Mytilus californianus]
MDDDASPLSKIFSCPTQADEEKAHGIMDRFVELGGNFIDTANMYCRGQSEHIVGTWLKKKSRDNVVVATKCRFPMSTEPNDKGLSRRHIIKCCEDSLERLQTNYIDLYQTHIWDDATPIEETLRTLDDLVRCGKIRYIGVSNLLGWQTQKVVDYTKFMGLTGFISMQQQYNLLVRHPELEEFQVCKTEGLGVLPWSPLSSGMLTGKYKRDEKMDPKSGRLAHDLEKNSKASFWTEFAKDTYWDIMAVVAKVAKTNGKTAAQVALRWLLQKDVVSSIIIGATSIKQLDENMSVATGWSISKEDMETLDEVSKPESASSYPYQMSRLGNTLRVNRFNPKPVVANI